MFEKILKFKRKLSLMRKQRYIKKMERKGLRVGRNCDFVSIPDFSSEPYLISIGDNTTISFECVFITHDAATRVIRNLPNGNKETVIYGPISIGNNCFITQNTSILVHFFDTRRHFYFGNVTIGDNCFIGMNTLICKSVCIGN